MMKPPDTPVIALLRLVWKQANTETGFSWERLNHSMYTALHLAIGAGFPFVADDFATVYKDFSGDRWMSDSEWVYTFAISEGNPSAATAFEKWKDRTPFIADDVEPARVHGGYAHLTGQRQRERLHIGAEFLFAGKRRKVTSFADDQQSLTACTYHKPKEGEYQSKAETRVRVTREAIISDRADRKERGVLNASMMKLADSGKITAKGIIDKLGVKTRQEYDVLPLKKIRKVLDALGGELDMNVEAK